MLVDFAEIFQVYFGQNVVCKELHFPDGNGPIIKVGDPVYVLHQVSSPADAAV